jgi:hypothetical protein
LLPLITFEGAREALVQMDAVEIAARDDSLSVSVNSASLHFDLPPLGAWLAVGVDVARSVRFVRATAAAPPASAACRRVSLDVKSATGSVGVGADARMRFLSSGLLLSATGASVHSARVFVGDDAASSLLALERCLLTSGAGSIDIDVASVKSSVRSADVVPLVAAGSELVRIAAGVRADGGDSGGTQRPISLSVKSAEFQCSPSADVALPQRYTAHVSALDWRSRAGVSSLALGALSVDCDSPQWRQ